MSISTDALADAWKQFAEYEWNARAQQRTYFRLQKTILGLGFLATLLAVLETSVKHSSLNGSYPTLATILHYSIIFVPAVAAVLVGALAVFKPGVRWVLLRSGAEGIKREIYLYRTSIGQYKDLETADGALVTAVNNLSDMTELGDLESFALAPYPYADGANGIPFIPRHAAHKDDPGFNHLTGEEYERFRLEDQLGYFARAVGRLGNRRNISQVSTVVLGGSGSILAALNFSNWVPATIALGAAFASYLQYMQVEETLVKYNWAKHCLRKVQRWWLTLDASKKLDPDNVDHLVRATEGILAAEMTGWARQMADAVRRVPKVGEHETSTQTDEDKASDRNSKLRHRRPAVAHAPKPEAAQPASRIEATVSVIEPQGPRPEAVDSAATQKEGD